MPELEELMARLVREASCSVAPAAGQPRIAPPYRIPADLAAFYQQCGGAVLYAGATYCWEISPPDRLVSANEEILGERFPDDITSSWFVVARERDAAGSRISIDLGPARLGWCYDSFDEVHGVAGSSAVLAHSFGDLLEHLVEARGEELFWEEPGFTGLGDAYDED
ncbi:hypothetical protein ACTOB_001169 [Actinoplanes oblitus]|uniref:Knr4/Smi1-like domain-containing protein n=1 Tax=Actinoplanes oblitus TaxID=3040509 RepID=A0ABY8WIB7_9ACTN|nr:hypothetical protein [Actinoplanes oblitus]WIM97629.1 hypothetical protein ACTOB_001169 [Actinoplanes oblitus]